MELNQDELTLLEREGVYVGPRTFLQCFQPYLRKETMELHHF